MWVKGQKLVNGAWCTAWQWQGDNGHSALIIKRMDVCVDRLGRRKNCVVYDLLMDGANRGAYANETDAKKAAQRIALESEGYE